MRIRKNMARTDSLQRKVEQRDVRALNCRATEPRVLINDVPAVERLLHGKFSVNGTASRR